MNRSEKSGLKILSAMSVMQALRQDILPAWSLQAEPVDVAWMPTSLILEQLNAGESCDIVIATREAIDELTLKGLLMPQSVRNLVSSAVGFAVMSGTPLPDLSSKEKLIASLLSYSRIAYSERGASGILFRQCVASLGIAEEIKQRTVSVYAGLSAEKILSGEAEIAVQQVSELLAAPGVSLAGVLPKEYGCNLDFALGIFHRAALPDIAEEFIDFLLTDAARDAFHRSGLQPSR